MSSALEPEMTAYRWRDAVRDGAVAFVLLAAFPRLGRWMRWPTRLSPPGLLAYIAFNTALGFALRAWALPYFRRMAQERAHAEEELRRLLGREPTEKELLAHLGIAGTPPTRGPDR